MTTKISTGSVWSQEPEASFWSSMGIAGAWALGSFFCFPRPSAGSQEISQHPYRMLQTQAAALPIVSHCWPAHLLDAAISCRTRSSLVLYRSYLSWLWLWEYMWLFHAYVILFSYILRSEITLSHSRFICRFQSTLDTVFQASYCTRGKVICYCGFHFYVSEW